MKQDFGVVNGKIVVTLSGRLYVEDAAILRERLLQYIDQGYKDFIVDMASVDYIDSSGLGVLVAIQKRSLQNGGGVAIKGAKGVVQEIFELTRLTKVFEMM